MEYHPFQFHIYFIESFRKIASQCYSEEFFKNSTECDPHKFKEYFIKYSYKISYLIMNRNSKSIQQKFYEM